MYLFSDAFCFYFVHLSKCFNAQLVGFVQLQWKCLPFLCQWQTTKRLMEAHKISKQQHIHNVSLQENHSVWSNRFMVSEIPAQWNNAGVASQLLIVRMPHWDGYGVTFLAHTKGMVSDMCRQTTNLRAGAATCIEFKLSSSHPTIVWFEQNFHFSQVLASIHENLLNQTFTYNHKINNLNNVKFL